MLSTDGVFNTLVRLKSLSHFGRREKFSPLRVIGRNGIAISVSKCGLLLPHISVSTISKMDFQILSPNLCMSLRNFWEILKPVTISPIGCYSSPSCVFDSLMTSVAGTSCFQMVCPGWYQTIPISVQCVLFLPDDSQRNWQHWWCYKSRCESGNGSFLLMFASALSTRQPCSR